MLGHPVLARLFFLGSLLVPLSGSVLGAVLTVTTASDTPRGVCDAVCTLRDAVDQALPGDEIVFNRNMRGATIEINSPIVITGRITITGPLKRRITIKGKGSFRIVHIKLRTSGQVVTLRGLNITGGAAPNGYGGGVYTDPSALTTLVLDKCSITENTADSGGGIYSYFGNLFISDSTIANNTAAGIHSAGGIHIRGTTVRIFNSTISGNVATSVQSYAGGIAFQDSNGWSIGSSTISNNISYGKLSISVGGIATPNGVPGPITNTILADNQGVRGDFYGRVSGARYILVSRSHPNNGFINGVDGNIVGTLDQPLDAGLAPLGMNGGSISTHSLLLGSPAIDAGNNALSVDRRSEPLIADERGYRRIEGKSVDIGAYEVGSNDLRSETTLLGRVFRWGRGMPRARVTLLEPDGKVRIVETNPSGYFRFYRLRLGDEYSVTVEGKGVRPQIQTVVAEEAIEEFSATF